MGGRRGNEGGEGGRRGGTQRETSSGKWEVESGSSLVHFTIQRCQNLLGKCQYFDVHN